jgi:four helix bundle protein
LGEGASSDSRGLQEYAVVSERRTFRADQSNPSLVGVIPASLAEGCGRRSDGEMGRFIQIAMGSGAELSYHLLLARDLGLLEGEIYQGLDADLGGIMPMMSSLSQKIRGRASNEKS